MQIHEIADMVKNIGPVLAEKILASSGVAIEYNWEEHAHDKFAAMLAAVSDGSADDFAAIDERFEAVAALMSAPKNRKIMQDYLADKNMLPEDAEERKKVLGYSCAKIAAYCVSTLSTDHLKAIKERTYVNAKSGTGWKNFEIELFADIPQNAIADHIPELVENLKSYVKGIEGCADHAVPLAFRRDTDQIFVLKMDDRPVDVEVWKDEASDFTYIAQSQSVKLAVILDEKNNRIGVSYRQGKKAEAIARIFCDTALGSDSYKLAGEITYDLSYFVKNSISNLGGTEDGAVRNVTVVELQVNLLGVKDSRRTYCELKKDLYETIRPELADMVNDPAALSSPTSVFPIGTTARKVKLRVEYDTDRKTGLQKTIEFSPTTDTGLKGSPRHVSDGLFRLLHEKGIAKRNEACNDGKSAGTGDSKGA